MQPETSIKRYAFIADNFRGFDRVVDREWYESILPNLLSVPHESVVARDIRVFWSCLIGVSRKCDQHRYPRYTISCSRPKGARGPVET